MNAEVVVITGASGGIGRACAREFAKRGPCKIGLLARGIDGLEAARREVERAGSDALVVPVDVADHEAVELAAARVEERFGPIDIWVNDAFTNVFSEFLDITPEEYRRVTDVTYLGYVWGTRAALRRMLPRDCGTIVQVASAVTYRSIPLQSAYSGSKAGIRGFTDSLRCELHHRGSKVHLTSVNMPAVNTPQFSWNRAKLPRKPQPIPPIFQPEVAARAVWYAAHLRRREVTVGLSSLVAVNANKFIAGLLDRYLGKTGYDSQQYDGGLEPNRPDNLFEPAKGDFGAHGDFDARSRSRSLELELTTRPVLLGAVATLTAWALNAAFHKISDL
jgi:NAD(P)-dependent dehydrogenase (short-subunit alcohol dehydrogenase family)